MNQRSRERAIGLALVIYVVAVLGGGAVLNAILDASHASDAVANAVVTIGTIAGLAALFSMGWWSEFLNRFFDDR